MRIPKSFKMHGHKIEVVHDPQLLHKNDNRGEASYRESKIRLQPCTGDNPIPDSHIEESFCHELIHLLFHHAGYSKDRSDESKVWRLGLLLHQALSTMEYEE